MYLISTVLRLTRYGEVMCLAREVTGEEKENGGSSPHSLELLLILPTSPFYPFIHNSILQKKASTQVQYMKKCCTYSEHSYDNSNVLY